MKNKENLINEIKTKRIKQDELDNLIHEQEIKLVEMVNMDLNDMGIITQYRKGDKQISIYKDDKWSINRDIRISFGGGNFHIQFPHIINEMNSYIQIQVFKVLSKYENELTDIQLDYLANYDYMRRDEEFELQNVVAEEMFNTLEKDGFLELNGRIFKMEKWQKGRYIITFPNEYTKSYFKKDILSILFQEAREVVKSLVKI